MLNTEYLSTYEINGDRNPSNLHDHVILPKTITDDFYSTWTQCYEELFHASLSPKYVQRKDSTASRVSNNKRTTPQYFPNGLKHSVSDLHLAQHCDVEPPMSDYSSRKTNRNRSNRLSLDITNTSLDYKQEAAGYRRHQRHMSDPEPPSFVKCTPSTADRTNFGKFFGAFNGRKKVYKLPE